VYALVYGKTGTVCYPLLIRGAACPQLHSSHASSPAPQADHDDKEHKALNAFNELWRAKFARDSLLVFSTGRSHALYKKLQAGTPKQRQQPGS